MEADAGFPLAKLSLRQYLGIENPVIDNSFLNKKGNNTTVADPHTLLFVEEWKDFSLDALLSFDSGAISLSLQDEFDCFDHSSKIAKYPVCEIHGEDSFTCLLVRWNHAVVSDALQYAQSSDPSDHEASRIYMVKAEQAKGGEHIKKNGTKSRSDWAGIIKDGLEREKTKPENVLPGETKLSSKWKSEWIEAGKVTVKSAKRRKWLQPLVQIFTYCCRCEVRYGYIITDEELVVVRVKARPNNNSRPDEKLTDRIRYNGVLQYKSIPWESGPKSEGPDLKSSFESFGDEEKEVSSRDPQDSQRSDAVQATDDSQRTEPQRLTVNLALFCLHYIAHRERYLDDKYPPLGQGRPSTPPAQDSQASFTSDTSNVRRQFAGSSIGGPPTTRRNQNSIPESAQGKKRGRENLRQKIQTKKQKGNKIR